MTTAIDIGGWTLLHFIWQGAIIWSVTVLVLRLLRDRSADARYATGCVALVTMLAAPIGTAIAIASQRADPRASVSSRSAEQTAPSPTGALSWMVRSFDRLADAAPTGGTAPTPRHTNTAPIASVTAWLPLVVAVWAAGVALLAVRLAGGWWRISRMHRAALHAPLSRWSAAADRVAGTLDLRRRVRVVDSAQVDTPAVLGWIRPVIVLPIAALSNLSPSQIDAILAHELAHIRRHDFIVNVLQTVAETLLFYHPAVWWVSTRIRAEREHCCDTVAVAICGDPVSYAEALTELESWRTADALLAVMATGGSLIERIRQVLGAGPTDRSRSMAAPTAVAALVVLLIAAGATRYLRAEAPQQPEAGASAADTASRSGMPDALAWRMAFNHQSSELSIIGYTGRDLIRYAYQIPKARVLGGPAWIDDESFRIVQHLDGPPAADEMPSIIRRVLEEQFQLRVHVEPRDFPARALVMVRPAITGPNLRLSAIDCFDRQAWIDAGQPPREIRRNGPRQPVCGEQDWNSNLSLTSYVAITMAEFARELRGITHISPGPIDPEVREVLDRTGLSGRYDIDLHVFLPTAALMARFPLTQNLFEAFGLPSMDRALEEQLGLELVDITAPFDVIVVDHAERPQG